MQSPLLPVHPGAQLSAGAQAKPDISRTIITNFAIDLPPRATGAQGSRASPCLAVQLQRIRPAARRSASRAGASVCRYLGQHLPRTDARTVASRSAFGARR